ncbi:hypothetical protein B0T09DRAFT_233893, partial [Sordaria sp. MPI-SDFR-AT-0083]
MPIPKSGPSLGTFSIGHDPFMTRDNLRYDRRGLFRGPFPKTASLTDDHRVPIPKKATFVDICLRKQSSEEAFEFWRSLVSEYSLLGLTYDSDRDVALSGIRQAFNADGRFQYYAGLWIQDLPRSLLWTKNCRHDDEQENQLSAPSWSWLCRYRGNRTFVD